MIHFFKFLYYRIRTASHVIFSIFSGIHRKSFNKLESYPDRRGCTSIVTGGGKGIGEHVVKGLVKCGMHVIVGVRDPASCRILEEEINNEKHPGTVEFLKLDLSSMSSVRSFAGAVKKQHQEIHLLVNNAGVYEAPRGLTEDGFEIRLATNYIGHFLLTHLLLDNLKLAGKRGKNCSRIVNVSSCSLNVCQIMYDDIHCKKDFYYDTAYAQSKLAQLMFTRYLDRELQSQNTPVKCLALHPGLVNTAMTAKYREYPIIKFFKSLLKSAEEGATSVLYSCLSEDLEREDFLSDCRPYYSSRYSKNECEQKKLFEYTLNMLRIEDFGSI